MAEKDELLERKQCIFLKQVFCNPFSAICFLKGGGCDLITIKA